MAEPGSKVETVNAVDTPQQGHPADPHSNVIKFGSYDPEKYALSPVSQSQLTSEALLPNRPPCLTQRSIGMFLKAKTRELDEVPPLLTIDELSEAVVDRMVFRDKAFWVDKPGSNAYNLTDAFYNFGMATDIVKPNPQAVFPRSYQYDLDCVNYRRTRACEGMQLKKDDKTNKKPIGAHCRDCDAARLAPVIPFNMDSYQKRWRDYPNVSTPLSMEELQHMMLFEVGRPFQNEACNYYNKNFPSQHYDVIMRKFST